MITLLIADDQALVRGALAALLNLEKDLQVVAEVGSGTEIVAAALKAHVDVALIDIEMPGMDGITATQALTDAPPHLCHHHRDYLLDDPDTSNVPSPQVPKDS